MLHRIFTALVVLLALACGSPEAWAQRPDPEFRVNTFTANDQSRPAVARLSDGSFVVTWQSAYQDGANWGVYGQRYSAAGTRVGDEFRVNSYTPQNQERPSVAGLSGGGFVVTWRSMNQDAFGGGMSGWGVYGQRYTAAGARIGEEFQVNTFTAGLQHQQSVAGLNNGGFVITWASLNQEGFKYEVYGQRYSAAGAPAGSEFRVNTKLFLNQSEPSVAALGGGGFVVTWTSEGGDCCGRGISGQRYTTAGAPIGVEFQVNPQGSGYQDSPSVAALGDGGFVATWVSYGQDGSESGIYGQRYSAAGARIGLQFRANTTTADFQLFPSVAGLSGGGFVVTWESNLQDGSGYGVYGQRYSAAGARVGGEFRVNTTTANDQVVPSVAGLGNDGFVVTWTSKLQDGSVFGVYGRRYGNFAPEITLNPVSQTVRSGQTVTFTADATAMPTPSVQWQRSTNGGASFTDIAGATAKTLSFPTTLRQNGNRYRAVFSNSLGTATTNAATLTVLR